MKFLIPALLYLFTTPNAAYGLNCSNILNSAKKPPIGLKNITEDYIRNLEDANGDIFVKFVVLPDQNGEFTRLIIQDPKEYRFHYQFLQTLEEFKNMSQTEIDEVTYDGTPRLLPSTVELFRLQA